MRHSLEITRCSQQGRKQGFPQVFRTWGAAPPLPPLLEGGGARQNLMGGAQAKTFGEHGGA